MVTQQGELLAGRYRLLASFGRGGMGVVWHAHDEVLGRDVAVKEVTLPPGFTAEERQDLFRRTLREARAAARLNHPNVVTVFDVVDAHERPWIVMEFVPSRSLADVLAESGPLPPAEVAEVGLHVLDALTAAHAAGILHRDVKPGNVLLGERGRIVLTDFGIATLEGDTTLTRTGALIGSPAYIAPERAAGHRVGPASDLWSLGATLYAAVEGRPPYDRGGPMATLAAVATEEPDTAVRAGPLAPVLEGLLRKDPAERIGPGEAARLLRAALTAPPVTATPPAATPPAATPPAATPWAAAPSAPSAATPPAVPPPTVPPPTVPPPRETPPPASPRDAQPARAGSSRRLLPLLALVAVLILAGAAFLVRDWFDDGSGRGAAPREPSASPSAQRTASPSRSPSPNPSPSPSPPPSTGAPAATAPVLPAGFRWYRDPTGFSLAIPDGWRITRRDHYVYVREPNGARFLLIDQTTEPKADAVADWQQQEAARQDEIRDYRRIRIVPVDYYLEAADWEFTHTGTSGTPLHVLSRGFVTSKSQAYGLYWSTPESQWSASLRYFDVFASTFRPRAS